MRRRVISLKWHMVRQTMPPPQREQLKSVFTTLLKGNKGKAQQALDQLIDIDLEYASQMNELS